MLTLAGDDTLTMLQSHEFSDDIIINRLVESVCSASLAAGILLLVKVSQNAVEQFFRKGGSSLEGTRLTQDSYAV